MDLKFSDARADSEERAAIDAVLGPPASGWDGGERDALDGHIAIGGTARAQEARHLLLPALHAAQNRVGWISPGALDYICRRLSVPPAEAYGVATFYHLFSVEERAPSVMHVCDDIACRATGALELIAEIEAELGAAGTGNDHTWLPSPCLGRCEQGRAAFFVHAGEEPHRFSWAPFESGEALKVLRRQDAAVTAAAAAPQTLGDDADLRLLSRVGRIDPESLGDYEAAGGLAALARAREMGGEAVIRELIASKLQGRGGAAFPAGVKWQAVAESDVRPRYVVCNADESEPGTFKDRVLMGEDPFAVVEAITIMGEAVEADRGYIYIRGEYPLAEDRLENALAEFRNRGLLGSDEFDIEIRRGAGAYICGEETALFNSIEGLRGEPRQKPPFPTQAGLFGKPTVVNNVETLLNILDIVQGGGDSYAAIGTAESTGTKLFCLSGHIERPGVYEFPFGVTLGEVLEAAGGVTGDLAAVLVGGAAGSFVGPDQLDIELTFEGARAAGVSLGSGVIMPFSSSTDFADITRRIAEFFADESCGQCVPCRVGTVRQAEALERLSSNGGSAGEVDLIGEIAMAMRDASICGLGQTASGAIQSAIALGLLNGSQS